MSHNHPKKYIPYCLNCHYPLAEMDSFCPNCGQKPTDGKTSMHDLIHEFVHTLFHLDGKFFTTLKHIFVPGKLTIEFFKGHHKRYAHPVQLFLVLGALLFGMIANSTKKLEKTAEEREHNSRQKLEQKAFLRLIDSIGQATAPSFEGKKTERSYDTLLMRTYQHWQQKESSKKQETTGKSDSTKNKKSQRDTSYSLAGGIIQVRKDIDDDENEKNIPKNTDEIEDTSHKQSNWDEFKEGLKKGYKNGKENKKAGKNAAQIINESLDLNRKKENLEDVLNHEDSTTVSQMFASIKIPTTELYELTADKILDKYSIHDFWKRLTLKQAIKAQQDPKNLLHFVMGKLLWFTFLLIPMMSGLFMLLYRKKNYFVEHFIFFMHYNIFLFAGSIFIIFINDKFGFTSLNTWFVLGVFVFFYFAMKNCYQQSWKKTFLKFCIANFGYMVFSLILTVLGATLSFLLF